MTGNNVLVLKNFGMIKAPGVHYRLVCMSGQKKGDTYYLKGNRVVMGRADTCDIQIMDNKSSREHAEIIRLGAGFVLTDLKSHNGVMINDVKITQHNLVEGDTVVIGQTVYKYGRISVKDEEAEIGNSPGSLLLNNTQEEEQSEQKIGKNKLIVLLLSLGVLYMLIGGGEDKELNEYKDPTHRAEDINDEFSQILMQKQLAKDKEMDQKLKEIFHRGLRELREKNYFRSINEFNLALILNPGNGRAQFYLDRAKQSLDEDIKNKFVKGIKDVNALRFKRAVVEYCSILRLLQSRQDDERFITAQENIREMEKKMGLETGEIKCL